MIDKDILFTETMALFAERGVKMTMDELAARLRVLNMVTVLDF